MRVSSTLFRRVAALSGVALLLLACSKETDPVVLFETGDYASALSRFQGLASEGDIEASNYLGVHYYVGAGVERDFLAAARWFEIAALEGHTGAQKNLGMMYFRGLGVEIDNHRAFGWLYHAQQGGNEEAQKYLKQLQTKVTPNASVIAMEVISKQLENKQPVLSVRE